MHYPLNNFFEGNYTLTQRLQCTKSALNRSHDWWHHLFIANPTPTKLPINYIHVCKWGFLWIFSAKIGSTGLEGKNLDNLDKSGGLVSMVFKYYVSVSYTVIIARIWNNILLTC